MKTRTRPTRRRPVGTRRPSPVTSLKLAAVALGVFLGVALLPLPADLAASTRPLRLALFAVALGAGGMSAWRARHDVSVAWQAERARTRPSTLMETE